MLSKRSNHPRQLVALVVTTSILLASGAMGPALLAANPPHKPPVPRITKATTTNWFGMNWSKLIPKQMPKIHIPAFKPPPKMKAPKAAHIPKLVPKQHAPAPQSQPRVKLVPNAPKPIPQQRIAAPKPQPIMKPALHELTEAWLYVNASPLLPTRSRNAVSGHIGQALTALGGGMPKANTAGKKGNHLKLAEEHLHRANKEVLLLTHLSSAVQKAVIKEIKRATDLVKKHANAIAGKDAKP